MDSEFEGVVIFDGDCPVCSRTAGIIRRIDDVGVIAWNDEAAQAFLGAEFDPVPFSMIFADGASGTIYVGEAAAKELAERAGVPGRVSSFIEGHYHSVASTLQRTVGSGIDPDPVGGTVDLTAVEAYEEMRDAAVAVEGDIDHAVDDA